MTMLFRTWVHLRQPLYRMGYSLAELIIAMAVLGLVAAMVVPSILANVGTQQNQTLANDAKLLVSGAFADYELATLNVPSSFALPQLETYLPFAKNLSAAGENVLIDCPPQGTALPLGCTGTAPRTASLTAANPAYTVLRLKSGALLVYPKTWTFAGTSTLNALPFVVDPNGKQNQGSDSVEYWLYTNGTVLTRQTLTSNTVNSAGTFSSVGSSDPAYLTLK
jgi:type II secretory pathway pseudopilin PulG